MLELGQYLIIKLLLDEKNHGGEPFESDKIPFGTPNVVHKFIVDEIEANQGHIGTYLELLAKIYKGEM